MYGVCAFSLMSAIACSRFGTAVITILPTGIVLSSRSITFANRTWYVVGLSTGAYVFDFVCELDSVALFAQLPGAVLVNELLLCL